MQNSPVIKFSVNDKTQESELQTYVLRITEGVNCYINNLVVECFDVINAKILLDRVIEDYVTFGFSIDEKFDLYEACVYCDEPELMNWYNNQRMNVNHTQLVALSDIMSDGVGISKDVVNRLDMMDALNEYNGIYKMRNIIYAIANVLEREEIHVGEAINSVVEEKLH